MISHDTFSVQFLSDISTKHVKTAFVCSNFECFVSGGGRSEMGMQYILLSYQKLNFLDAPLIANIFINYLPFSQTVGKCIKVDQDKIDNITVIH